MITDAVLRDSARTIASGRPLPAAHIFTPYNHARPPIGRALKVKPMSSMLRYLAVSVGLLVTQAMAADAPRARPGGGREGTTVLQ